MSSAARHGLMRDKIDKLARHYREGGVSDVAQRLTQYGYVPSWLFQVAGMDIMRLEKLNEAAVRRKVRGYVFRDATPADIPAIIAISDSPPPTLGALLERFFGEGHQAYVVCRDGDGEVVGYAWAFRGTYQLTVDDYGAQTLDVTLSESARFFGNGAIAPAYRMRGLFPHIIKHAMDQAPAGSAFYTSVNHMNAPSRRAHQRLGFSPVTGLVSLRLGGRHLWCVQPVGRPPRVRLGGAPVPLADLF